MSDSGIRSALVALLAGATTWFTMLTWAPFTEVPGRSLGPLALGCAIVAGAGIGLRLLHVPRAVVVIGQVVATFLFLNAYLAGSVSLGGFVPTPESFRASIDAVAAAIDASTEYAAPVPAEATAFPALIVVVGVLTALVVDLLACTCRWIPVAGLPLLALYTAPLSLLDAGVPWWKFALLAAGFLGMLAVEESGRVGQWGRSVTTHRTSRVALPAAGRIGVTATSLAIAIPLVIPTIDGGFFSGGPGSGGGGSSVRIVDPLVDLKRDLERGEDLPLMIVETNDPRPDYFRTAVLDEFDGESWRASDREIPPSQRANGTLPAPVGLTRDVNFEQYTYRVAATEDFASQWLAAPYPTTRVDVTGDWRYDESTLDLLSADESVTTAGLQWGLTALDVNPDPESFRAAGTAPGSVFTRYTEVDDEVPDWVGELAREVTEAGEGDAEKAKLLQDWFALPHPAAREEQDPSFTYSLSQSERGNGVDDLTDFLQFSRVGYCEQFSAAMALMARELDIPSRVAVGFLKPEATPSGAWVFSSHDLHAWPELYFDGIGWVVFEPTPSSRQGATPPAYTDALAPENEPEISPSVPSPSPSESPSASPEVPDQLPQEEQEAAPVDDQGGVPPWAWGLILAVPVLVGLVLAPRLARAAVRRRRWESAQTPEELAEAAWAELRDTQRDLGYAVDERLTLRHQVAELTLRFHRRRTADEAHRSPVIAGNPEADAAIGRILTVVERARYARETPTHAAIRADVDCLVEALRLGVTPAARRRADWLPASLLTHLSRRTTRRSLPSATALEG